MGQVGTISDQQFINNYGALYGYATRVNLRNCAIVLIHSVFAELSTTASQWYSVCYLDSNKRPTTRIVAPCVYRKYTESNYSLQNRN